MRQATDTSRYGSRRGPARDGIKTTANGQRHGEVDDLLAYTGFPVYKHQRLLVRAPRSELRRIAGTDGAGKRSR